MTFIVPEEKKVSRLYSRLTLFVAYCYFGEVVLGGPGSWSKDFLHVDVRKILFGCVCMVFLAGVLRCSKLKLIDAVILFGGTILFVVWIVVLPTLNDTDMSLSMADGIPIFSMFLVTIIFKMYSDGVYDDRFIFYEKTSNFILLISSFAAVVHLALFLVLNVWPEFGFEILIALKLILDNQDVGSIFVGPMPDGSIRVFWISSLFLVYGLYRSIGNMRFGIDRRKIALLLLFVAAILVTQTRSIFLAVPIALCFAGLFYVLVRYSRINLFSLSLIFAAILFSITFIQLALVSTDLMSLIGLAREGSDQERALQVKPLLSGWLNNFVFGGGFGFSVSYVRSAAAPFSYEFSILALYMKFGIIGLVVVWLYFIYMSNLLGRQALPLRRVGFEYGGLVFVIFVYFFIFNTNPYLSNSVGVAIFLLLCIEAARLFKNPRLAIVVSNKGNE